MNAPRPCRTVCFAWFVFALLFSQNAAAATLRVKWSGVGRLSGQITLIPVDVDLPEGVTRSKAIAQWQRAFAGPEQQWIDLPAGSYQIIRLSGGVPVDVGEVVLAADDDRTITIEDPDTPVSGRVPPQTIHLSFPSDDSVVITEWNAGVRTLVAAKRTPQGAAVSLPCTPGSLLLVESSSSIGTVKLADGCREPIALSLEPRATVTGRLAIPAESAPPSWGVIRCGQDFPFRIEGPSFRAAVPSRCHEASLRIPSFAPVALDLPKGALRELGTVKLETGGSAVVRVRSGRDAAPLGGVRVTAILAHELATMRKELTLDGGLGSTTTDAAGWARLDGLPQERLIFVVHPPTRALPHVSEPYEVAAGEVTVLDDVLIDASSNVSVTLVIDQELAKKLELGAVELTPTGHNHWPAHVPIRAELAADRAVVRDVPPGSWTVQAAGRLKNGFAIRIARGTVEVLPGMDSQVTLTIDDHLYQGHVTRDGLPLAGVINLTPVDRQSGRRSVVATIAEDGTFQVLLEGPGSYSAQIQESKSGGGAKLGRPVEFEDPADEVEIEMPNGRIRGRVIDAAGEPVKRVVIAGSSQLGQDGATAFGRNADDGTFVLDNVGPGTWELIATSADGRSEPAVVSMHQDELDGVTLTIEPVTVVKVKVVDASGVPVRDAVVAAEFPRRVPSRTGNAVTTTGRDGAAALRLTRAQQAAPVNVYVLSETPARRWACALGRLDGDRTIALSPHTGEVRLIGLPRGVAAVRRWLVASSGCSVPFIGTRTERDDDGESSVLIAGLPPGNWSYVETHGPEELGALVTGQIGRLAPIKSFRVEPGRTTRIELASRRR